MLDKLNQLVKENAQDAIVNNSEIPNEKNEEVVQAASGSIFDALKQQISSGNVSQLVDTFKGGTTENSPVVEQASAGFTDKLAGMGINLETAKKLAMTLIPGVMSKFVQKTNDPNDKSFDIQDILSNISGPDGKFQISDLTNMFNQGKTGSGDAGDEQAGLGDKLKGLF
ncbi:hypothetical protein [Pedobacter immunditicola]|uniref:hypothetical protein n=1 Tax=Pedobacter immunditicola TaxID=3133440 RepID=UPI0030A5C7AF